MALQIGIVGLPNVGKSTLFNALSKEAKAQAANYPFCTIDPNIGVVEVPDSRLARLAEIVKPEKVIPTVVEFVDIAGLVKGASAGEGLGNQFLSHIRECDAVAQVVRIFEDGDVTHVHGGVDPRRDIEIVETELILADLQTLEKRLSKARNDAKSGRKEALDYLELLERLNEILSAGKRAIAGDFSGEEKETLRDLHLLTMKKMLYIANVHENEIGKITSEGVRERLRTGAEDLVVVVSAKIEDEIGRLSPEEARLFLEDLGLKESGLSSLIHAAYKTLRLQTYFTAGVKEVRAWTFPEGAKAPQAASVIHTDFENGFIAAEVCSFDDFIKFGGENGAKEHGKLRIEGRDYVMKDGDVVHFRFNV